jgi:hypothetical protein
MGICILFFLSFFLFDLPGLKVLGLFSIANQWKHRILTWATLSFPQLLCTSIGAWTNMDTVTCTHLHPIRLKISSSWFLDISMQPPAWSMKCELTTVESSPNPTKVSHCSARAQRLHSARQGGWSFLCSRKYKILNGAIFCKCI